MKHPSAHPAWRTAKASSLAQRSTSELLLDAARLLELWSRNAGWQYTDLEFVAELRSRAEVIATPDRPAGVSATSPAAPPAGPDRTQ